MREPKIDFTQFFTYSELNRHLRALQRWKPEWTTLRKLGKSPDGRQVPLIEINKPDGVEAADKPAFLVHGNIHAAEVSGATSALYLAHALLAGAEDDAEVAALLDRVAFYICPRISVDGAEVVLTTGRPVRSRDRLEKRKNRIWPEDLNGDGRILQMRIPDPDGGLIALDEEPRLLFARRPDDESGQRYRVATEGLIHDWDGGSWGEPERTMYDFNRNWGVNWRPPHQQRGAGRYSFSEPEMRAVADFIFDHPNIFGILGFHTGPNAVLRPPSTGGDSSIEASDLAVFREVGQLGSKIMGFPIKAIHEYHGDFGQPGELWGHFPDWGYKALGLFVFEIELGILWNSVGFSTPDIFALTQLTRREAETKALAWHDAHPEAGVFAEWESFDHPQLGPVEIGGWTPVGRANVAPEHRIETWDRSRRFIFDLAARAPQLELSQINAEPLGSRVFRITCRVSNDGFLPTSVTRYGASVEGVDGVTVQVDRTESVEFVAGRNEVVVGHLGASEYRDLTWVVRTPSDGEPQLTLTAEAARCGKVAATVRLGGE